MRRLVNVTDQVETPLDAWRGDWGNSYNTRNAPDADNIAARRSLFRTIFQHLPIADLNSILEVGANVGANLIVLPPVGAIYATEPNDQARQQLISNLLHPLNVCGDAAHMLHWPDGHIDLVFTSGVLIHIPPHMLEASCRQIVRVARRWVLAIEYFSKEPREVRYRGQDGMLWTMDYGAYYLDRFPELKPVAAGFAWQRLTGLDDLNWWLLEKRQ